MKADHEKTNYELWEEIGIPEGWEVDGSSGECISNGAKQVWLDNAGRSFSIAEGFWLPGYYADVATAIAAIDAPDSIIADLSDRICHYQKENRPIRMDDLKAAGAVRR